MTKSKDLGKGHWIPTVMALLVLDAPSDRVCRTVMILDNLASGITSAPTFTGTPYHLSFHVTWCTFCACILFPASAPQLLSQAPFTDISSLICTSPSGKSCWRYGRCRVPGRKQSSMSSVYFDLGQKIFSPDENFNALLLHYFCRINLLVNTSLPQPFPGKAIIQNVKHLEQY